MELELSLARLSLFFDNTTKATVNPSSRPLSCCNIYNGKRRSLKLIKYCGIIWFWAVCEVNFPYLLHISHLVVRYVWQSRTKRGHCSRDWTGRGQFWNMWKKTTTRNLAITLTVNLLQAISYWANSWQIMQEELKPTIPSKHTRWAHDWVHKIRTICTKYQSLLFHWWCRWTK